MVGISQHCLQEHRHHISIWRVVFAYIVVMNALNIDMVNAARKHIHRIARSRRGACDRLLMRLATHSGNTQTYVFYVMVQGNTNLNIYIYIYMCAIGWPTTAPNQMCMISLFNVPH
jgi:hypothetical protein